ncbi:MAG: BTAD domain-containing putative transcriptional regulator [Burkholderiaceae bacterium]
MSDSASDRPALETDPQAVSQWIEFASDIAFAIDDRHQVAAWNRAAEQVLGYASQEVIGRRCAEILQSVLPGGEPLCMPDCELFRCFRGCRPRGVPSCRVRRKDGNWLSVAYSSLVMPTQSQGAPSGAVVAVVFLHEKEQPQLRAPIQGVLQIFALGRFGLAINGHGIAVEKWKRRQAVTLLKYLATQLDRPVHRERILDCLWPDVDEQRGWGRLKVTMYYLRTQLRAAGSGEDTVKTVGDSYLLRRDAVWVDADRFEQLVAQGRALQNRGRGDEALRCYDEAQFLYRGDYFEQDVFADWCAEERERLGEIYMEMLTRKAQCHAQLGEYAEAARVCRKGLVHDPCRESFHRTLMQHLVQLGHPAMALAQFRHCQAVLAREFGIEPMPETHRLYRQILAQESSAISASQVPSRSGVRLRAMQG